MAANFFQIKKGLNLGSQTSDPTGGAEGDFYLNTTTTSIRVFVGGAWHNAVLDDASQTLTNKNLVDASTTIVNSTDASKKINFTAAGTTGTTTTVASSQTANRTLTLPDATDTVVARATTDTLTNKTIAVGSNHVTGTAAKVPQFNATTGDLEASAVTNTELSYVSGVTSSIQTQLNAKQGSGSYITGLTGDVTATGPGSAAATVNSVGGSTAANVHNAELAANAATNLNTASTIVKRDASGNFSAGTITANLTGNASGSAASITGNLTGDVTSVGMTTTVASVGGSTATNVHNAELAANAATNLNTASTIVKRDASGNFSAGTITANLTGNASGSAASITGNLTGDVTSVGMTTTIAAGAVTNAKMANMAAHTYKGNNTASAAAPIDLTAVQLTAELNPFVGDSGSGGTKGLVPAPAAGDAAAGRVLTAAGTWGAAGTASPLTTKGDLYAFSTVNTRFPVGTDGQILQADSTQATGLSWLTSVRTKSYIKYGTFENNATTGWSLGTIGTLTNGLPTGTPTFGSGAAAALSISTVSTGQLAGSYSLSLASSAATTQGNMLATQAYNIDAQDQAKVLSFRFYYSATSGSANCNFSGTSSNSFAVAVYDVTNSAFIPVTGAFNLVQGSGVGIAQGTFQTNSNTASLRFIVYCANATSGAVTMLFDDFYVGPQSLAYGPAVTDWASYTPTLTGFGTTSSVSFQYRRNGDSLEVQGNFTFASATATQAQISLPSGLVIDNSKMSSAGVNLVGHLTSTGNSSTLWPDIVASGNNSWVGYSYRSSSVSGLAYRNGNDYSSSDTWSIFFRVPIVGWSSNTVMSADSDTRSVTFLAKKTATQSVTANTTNIAFTSLSKDSHAAWNGTDTYTVPVSGDYWVAYNAVDNGSTTNYGFIYLNGSSTGIFSSYGTSGGNFTGAALLAGIKAGDLITIRSAATTTLAATGSISIARVSGPATVAASESVNFRYSASSGQSLGASANTTLQFASKDYDTHNAFNGTTFTAPVSGKYEFSAVVGIGNTGFNAGTAIQLTASKNGSTHSYMDYFQTWSGQNYPYAKGTTSMQLNAGDTVTFVFYNNNSGALTSSTGANTWVTGKRVGN